MALLTLIYRLIIPIGPKAMQTRTMWMITKKNGLYGFNILKSSN
jgi:hypothetical protein